MYINELPPGFKFMARSQAATPDPDDIEITGRMLSHVAARSLSNLMTRELGKNPGRGKIRQWLDQHLRMIRTGPLEVSVFTDLPPTSQMEN